MKLKVIFPSNPLDRKSVDPDFSGEYAAVKLLGGEIKLFDFDAFRKVVADDNHTTEDWLRCFNDGRKDSGKDWIYRGWMMSPVEYECFADACSELGMGLINTALQYVACHCYPLAYSHVWEHAIDTYVQDKLGDEFDYQAMQSYFESRYFDGVFDDFVLPTDRNRSVFVKDWVKSAKGADNATVISDWNDESAARTVVANMRASRGKSFNEGYVFKKLENFRKRPDGNPDEWRAFFAYDRLVSFSPTYGPGGRELAPPQWLLDIAKKLPSDFYTVDVGVLDDGDIKIIETGDGGVSGLSPGQLPITFYSSILSILDNREKAGK